MNFNLVLLAKQLWKLVEFPDFLVTRILCGKYYKLSLPLRAGSIDTLSYVWTSLFSARSLLLLRIQQNIHLGYDVEA